MKYREIKKIVERLPELEQFQCDAQQAEGISVAVHQRSASQHLSSFSPNIFTPVGSNYKLLISYPTQLVHFHHPNDQNFQNQDSNFLIQTKFRIEIEQFRLSFTNIFFSPLLLLLISCSIKAEPVKKGTLFRPVQLCYFSCFAHADSG